MTVKGFALTPEAAADREAIRDCLARYCRGIDRRDRELLTGVYWPDATDDHIQYKGSAAGFIDWVLPLLAEMQITQHFLGQTLILLSDDEAGAETYFQAYHCIPGAEGSRDLILGGRYLDQFVRRQGEWRILERTVIADWFQSGPSLRAGWSAFGMGPPPPANLGLGGGDDPSTDLLRRFIG